MARVAGAALFTKSPAPALQLGRVGLITFWDDDEALDRFEAEHPLAARMAGGWHVRLEPLRAFGSWPGLPENTPRSRRVEHEGPAVVLTLGRARVARIPKFLRTSSKAEARIVDTPGAIWATAMARPPFFATCSLWESTEALSEYAYGSTEPTAHPDAIDVDRATPFHHQSAFIRFCPYRSEGHLEGRNPLAESSSKALV